jgi:WD40 repeat protein
MLTGRPPHRAATVLETLEEVRNREPASPRQLQPRLSLDLETICLKCLEKEPGRRYASALQLAEELLRFQKGEPIQARPVTAPMRLWRWCRRNPVLSSVSGLAAAALVGGITVTSILAVSRAQALQELQKADADRRDALIHTQRELAASELQKGVNLCQEGTLVPGLLWQVQSLKTAAAIEEGKAEDLSYAARANLGAWRHQLLRLRAIVPFQSGRGSSTLLTPDGKMLVVTSFGLPPRSYDVETGQALERPFPQVANIIKGLFSHDGRLFLVHTPEGAQIFDAATAKLSADHQPLRGQFESLALAPDGKTVLTTGARMDRTVRCWDLSTGAQVGNPLSFPGAARKVAINRNGDRFLTVWLDGTVRLGTIGQPFAVTQTLNARANDAAFHPDGASVVTAGTDGVVSLWRVDTGQLIRPVLQFGSELMAVTVAPDGQTLAVGGISQAAQQWDLATGRRVGMALHHQGPITDLAYTADGRILLTSSVYEGARLWDVLPRPQVPLSRLTNEPSVAVTINGEGGLLAVGGNDMAVHLWDVGLGKPIGDSLKHKARTVKLLFSPDDRLLMTGSQDGFARLWDTASRQMRGDPIECGNVLMHPAFSSDSRHFLLANGAGLLRIFDVATGKAWKDLGPERDLVASRTRSDGLALGKIGIAAWSADGHSALSGYYDEPAQRWDLSAGQPLEPRLFIAEQGGLTAASFSRDGRIIVIGTTKGFVQRWDVRSGERIGVPLRHNDSIETVAVSPSGRTFLTASRDQTARIWDLETGRPRGLPLQHRGSVQSAMFSPDGRLVQTRGADQTVRLWDAERGFPVGPPLIMQRPVFETAFAPDGTKLAISGPAGLFLLRVPQPLSPAPERLAAWLAATAGLELASSGELRSLNNEEWQERRRRLAELGGPPE